MIRPRELLTILAVGGGITLSACTERPLAPDGNELELSRNRGDRSKAEPMITMCHRTSFGDRQYRKIEISARAERQHRAHGDAMMGEPVPGMDGYIFDEDCQPVPSGAVACGSGAPINGSVVVVTAQDLADVRATGSDEVHGDVSVIGTLIADLSGLECLATVTGDLNISENTNATALDLPRLASVGQSLVVTNNALLTSISVPNPATVGVLLVTDNPELVTIDLSGLTGTFVGDLRIESNAALNSLDLTGLRTAAEVVSIDDNGANASSAKPLELSSLTTVGIVLDIGFNGNFSAIDVPVLTSVNQVEIIDNASLKSFSAPNLRNIGADLRIEVNEDLVSVNLRNLRTVGEVVSIDFNGVNASSVKPLKLSSLTTVGFVLDIGFNANFSAIHVPVLTSVDRIEIIDNDSLRSISAPMLRDIGSMLQINDHRDLSALNLKALQTVGDLFQIRDNVMLCESIAQAIAARVTVPVVDIGGNRQHISCERRHERVGNH